MKISDFLSENFQFLEVKFSMYMYLNRPCFRNAKKILWTKFRKLILSFFKAISHVTGHNIISII